MRVRDGDGRAALYPSGFTQLSNPVPAETTSVVALYPSGFTQLSNGIYLVGVMRVRFVPLWIYTALKLQLGQSAEYAGFVPLWIYTALKRRSRSSRPARGFVPLWIYTALKRKSIWHGLRYALYPSGFTQLSNSRQGPGPSLPALYPSGFTQLSNLILRT